MKKLYFVIIILFVFLCGNIHVNAMTLKPNGPVIARRGEEITLYIELDRAEEEKEVSAIEGIFSYDEDILELKKSSILLDGWTDFMLVNNSKIFSYANLYFTNLINASNVKIIELVFKVNDIADFGNTLLTVSNTSATDEVGNAISINGGSHIIKILCDINTLEEITVEGAEIEFDEDKTNYEITLDSEATVITALKKDDSSIVSGDIGNKSLDYGLNTFNIVVTSESGIKKTYILNINRPDNRSKINTLSNLEVDVGKFIFDKDKLSYDLIVEYDITDVNIKALLTDNKSSFEDSYGPRTVKLDVGKNIIEIKVKAENGEGKVYTLNIVRKEKKETIVDHEINNNLSTGDFWIIPICVIGVLSLVFLIYFYIKNRNK